MTPANNELSIVVIGASGDLARKKIFPALFALYCQGYLPGGIDIFGFARSAMDTAGFRKKIAEHLTCRYVPGESCAEKTAGFLDRCHYVRGEYESRESFLDLYGAMKKVEPVPANRVFFLAIPPAIFLSTAHAIAGAGLVYCGSREPWSRVIVEKPFGHDRASSDALVGELGRVFSEEQTFRIDHYLGKEVVQNLMVLRFANTIFEPLWNRQFIRNVRILWKENFGCEGRGGYFDEYGIVRDVMQNHLLQILALAAMERPASIASADVRKAKVEVLRAVEAPAYADFVTAQYTAGAGGQAYRDEPLVKRGSQAATYAAAVLKIGNERWRGVPFLMEAGKALDDRMTEIRIRFNGVPSNIFCAEAGCPLPDELVARVQPDEAIYFRINSKVPGLDMKLEQRDLDLQYKTAFSQVIPDAYECLLLDVIQGDRSLFIGRDELAAAWDIFTPVLAEIDRNCAEPEMYEYGARRPQGAVNLGERYGFDMG